MLGMVAALSARGSWPDDKAHALGATRNRTGFVSMLSCLPTR